MQAIYEVFGSPFSDRCVYTVQYNTGGVFLKI